MHEGSYKASVSASGFIPSMVVYRHEGSYKASVAASGFIETMRFLSA